MYIVPIYNSMSGQVLGIKYPSTFLLPFAVITWSIHLFICLSLGLNRWTEQGAIKQEPFRQHCNKQGATVPNKKKRYGTWFVRTTLSTNRGFT